MRPFRLAALSFALVLANACGSARSTDPAPLRAEPPGASIAELPVRSAGDLSGAAKPDRSDAEIAALRAKGPAALTDLFRAFDALPEGPKRDALAATIDRVARQRYATVSRLYWYTDLTAAKKAAAEQGKPILSLRMLGNLDEDLSCANSRLFRTVLYANAAIAKKLRESFVLHWSSERPVPRVTIDFGDGRRIENTLTGNSAHYVLSADGAPLDVLPGMYVPSVFQTELEASLQLARAAATAPSVAARHEVLIAYHQRRAKERNDAWRSVGRVPIVEGSRRLLSRAGFEDALALAQLGAMTKSRIEMPLLRAVDVGADPGTLAEARIEEWAAIGQRLFAIGDPPVLERDEKLDGPFPRVGRKAPVRKIPVTPEKLPDLLDAQSRRLVEALVQAGPNKLDESAVGRILDALAHSMVADAAKNEMVLRQTIHAWLALNPDMQWTDLNQRIYSNLFHTPAEDPWLGLRPQVAFTGLPGDGVARLAPAR
jgi:hypothetical protein